MQKAATGSEVPQQNKWDLYDTALFLSDAVPVTETQPAWNPDELDVCMQLDLGIIRTVCCKGSHIFNCLNYKNTNKWIGLRVYGELRVSIVRRRPFYPYDMA